MHNTLFKVQNYTASLVPPHSTRLLILLFFLLLLLYRIKLRAAIYYHNTNARADLTHTLKEFYRNRNSSAHQSMWLANNTDSNSTRLILFFFLYLFFFMLISVVHTLTRFTISPYLLLTHTHTRPVNWTPQIQPLYYIIHPSISKILTHKHWAIAYWCWYKNAIRKNNKIGFGWMLVKPDISWLFFRCLYLIMHPNSIGNKNESSRIELNKNKNKNKSLYSVHFHTGRTRNMPELNNVYHEAQRVHTMWTIPTKKLE